MEDPRITAAHTPNHYSLTKATWKINLHKDVKSKEIV